MIKKLLLWDNEIAILVDALDLALQDAHAKVSQYRIAANETDTDTEGFLSAERLWIKRAEAIRKLKADHWALNTDAE